MTRQEDLFHLHNYKNKIKIIACDKEQAGTIQKKKNNNNKKKKLGPSK